MYYYLFIFWQAVNLENGGDKENVGNLTNVGKLEAL